MLWSEVNFPLGYNSVCDPSLNPNLHPSWPFYALESMSHFVLSETDPDCFTLQVHKIRVHLCIMRQDI